jgi:hypothetical protein
MTTEEYCDSLIHKLREYTDFDDDTVQCAIICVENMRDLLIDFSFVCADSERGVNQATQGIDFYNKCLNYLKTK